MEAVVLKDYTGSLLQLLLPIHAVSLIKVVVLDNEISGGSAIG